MSSKIASIEIQVRIGNTWESPGCSRKEATIEAPTLIEAHTQALACVDSLRTTDAGTWGESTFRLLSTDVDGSRYEEKV